MVLALGWLALGCGSRGCGVKPQRAPSSDRDEPRLTGSDVARCRDEVQHGAVAVLPGAGGIDGLFASCDGDHLRAWVSRGHTLSTTRRALREASPWSPAVIVASGVEGLALVPQSAGPLVWRSPTAAIEGMEGVDTEEWWVLRGASGAGPYTRGSLSFARNVQGRGALAAIDGDAQGAVSVLGSVIVEGDEEARVVRAEVRVPSGENLRFDGVPERLARGELRAFARGANVALVERAESGGGFDNTRIEAYAVDGARLVLRGSHALLGRHVLVVARGASRGREALFALATFERVRASAGCVDGLSLSEELCVRPGPVLVLRVDGASMRVTEIAPAGLPDAVEWDPDPPADGSAVVLYVGNDRGRPSQRAARMRADGSVSDSWALRAEGLPPLDRPTMISCAGELWMLGEVTVPSGDEDGGASESAAMAVPVKCTR
jgi:hypothetical protein